MVSLSAFGQGGPQRSYVGYGPSLDAWAGLDSLTSYPGDRPQALGGVFPDTGSALYVDTAVIGALLRRDATGEGALYYLSELEVSSLWPGRRSSTHRRPARAPIPAPLLRRTWGCCARMVSGRW